MSTFQYMSSELGWIERLIGMTKPPKVFITKPGTGKPSSAGVFHAGGVLTGMTVKLTLRSTQSELTPMPAGAPVSQARRVTEPGP